MRKEDRAKAPQATVPKAAKALVVVGPLREDDLQAYHGRAIRSGHVNRLEEADDSFHLVSHKKRERQDQRLPA